MSSFANELHLGSVGFGILALLAAGCAANAGDAAGAAGGSAQGGSSASGGSSATTGGAGNSSGGSNTGGIAATGGSNTGGAPSTGGSNTGGAAPTGGANGTGGSIATGGTNGTGGGTPYTPKSCAPGSSTKLPSSAPTLRTDSWTKISPPVFDQYPIGSSNFALTQGMTIDPCNPAVVYVCVPTSGSNVPEEGLWRSNDGGASWELVHNFGSCVNIRVDPTDPLHLYVGDGVAGGANGFYVSTDGGKTFAMPQGFKDFANANSGAYDVYHVEPDPTDFKHVLLTFHSGWNNGDSAVAESFDGGDSFKKSALVGGSWAGGYNALMLYEPSLGVGDAKTWLFGTQGKGYYRTTDSGATWKKVSDVSMQHGGATQYYSKAGVLYVSGTAGTILRSTDNGETFTSLQPSGNGSTAYLSVIGDGTHLWTGNHGGGPFYTALESDDGKWSQFNQQTFAEGPFEMAVDHANGIVYSANIRGGVFALKISP